MTIVATDRSSAPRKPLSPSPRSPSPSPRSLSPNSTQRKRRHDSIIEREEAGKKRRRSLARSVSPQEPQEPENNEISEEAKSFIHKYTGDAKRWLNTEIERITVNNFRGKVFSDEDVMDAKKYIDDHDVEISSDDNELLTFLNDAPRGLIETVYDNFDLHHMGLYDSIGEEGLILDDMSTTIERMCYYDIQRVNGRTMWNINTILEVSDYDNADGYQEAEFSD